MVQGLKKVSFPLFKGFTKLLEYESIQKRDRIKENKEYEVLLFSIYYGGGEAGGGAVAIAGSGHRVTGTRTCVSTTAGADTYTICT